MNDYGIVTEAGTVRFERLLPGSIDRVWTYLTESEKRATWFAAGKMELRVGGRVWLDFRHANLTPHAETPPDKYRQMQNGVSMEGTITRCEPPRLLSYTANFGGSDSEVTFELTPRGDEVLLVLTHRQLAERPMMIMFASGWHTHLGLLADQLRGVVPPPFWATHGKLESEYTQRIAV